MNEVETMTDLIWENIDRKLYKEKLTEWKEAGASEYFNIDREKMYQRMKQMWNDKSIRDSIMLEAEAGPDIVMLNPEYILANRYLDEWIKRTSYPAEARLDAEQIIKTLTIDADESSIEEAKRGMVETFLFEFKDSLWHASDEENYDHPLKIAERIVERASLAKRLEEVENEIRRIRSLLELD